MKRRAFRKEGSFCVCGEGRKRKRREFARECTRMGEESVGAHCMCPLFCSGGRDRRLNRRNG